jgi:hypothetical protein
MATPPPCPHFKPAVRNDENSTGAAAGNALDLGADQALD